MEKKYYAIFERKITDRVIEREYENTPYPNSDGLIDYYNYNIGKFENICGIQVNSYEEFETYCKKNFPTIYREDEKRIIIREMK